MEFISLDQLPLIVFLILPGLISTKVYDLLVPGERREPSSRLLDALAYGLCNLGLWYAVLVDVVIPHRYSHPWPFRIAIALIFAASPVGLAIVVNCFLRWKRVRPWIRHPVVSAWDHFFSQREPGWVLIRLKSGGLMGGLFAERSFASSFPLRELYVEQTWRLSSDGEFLEAVPQSSGMLVSMAECESVEFFALNTESSNVEEDHI